ncbi:NADH-ubiquinone oxidoreductase subunit NDUFA12 family protein [Candidatus Tisiphia endosymbiont of Beris chalybata]|uniref:NADH-ubiquinone oxidoreductase subunit NDUFA12 family protein n=1 Tax=Candidatus Tisiphia endosymbiont of Beris chalybata TaxID=3066262 RepID=UPI00312CC1BF
MSFINNLFIYIFSKEVGKDKFGNKYYVSRKQDYLGRFKRQVIYNGKVEATKVPPLWHGWLHYMIDELPNNNNPFSWQLEYTPNISGTKLANVLTEKHEVKGKYNKWKPLGK